MKLRNRKLDRKDIKKAAKVLSGIPYNPVRENCLIAIPIETEKVQEFDGIELTVANKENGVKRPPEPVLLMNYDDKIPVVLGYVDITFARHFDLFDYCDIIDYQLPRNSEVLDDLEVYLVDKQNVLMSFEL